MLDDMYFIKLTINGYGWLVLIALFMFYNFAIIQLSHFIKQFFTKLFKKNKPFRGLNG